MSVSGICHECQRARADHDCRTCGRQVCDDHWAGELGVCSACARGLDGDGSGSDPPSGYR